MDSVLSKEVKPGTYQFSKFSELLPIFRYPDELTALIEMEDYASKEEYYGAFLYREKYNGHEFEAFSLHPKILNHATRLCDVIVKGIQRGKHHEQKENRIRSRLKDLITRIEAPLTGYMQHAELTFSFDGKTETTSITIIYNSLLSVQAYGRRIADR